MNFPGKGLRIRHMLNYVARIYKVEKRMWKINVFKPAKINLVAFGPRFFYGFGRNINSMGIDIEVPYSLKTAQSMPIRAADIEHHYVSFIRKQVEHRLLDKR